MKFAGAGQHEHGISEVHGVDDVEELGDSKGFADMEVRENIFPEEVDAEMSLQESALFPSFSCSTSLAWRASLQNLAICIPRGCPGRHRLNQ